MENQKNPEQPQEELWLDDILGPQESAQEIGPDEDAVASAGLTEPGDIELDALLEEIKSTGLMDGATAMLPQIHEEDRPAPEAEPVPAAESVPGSDAPLTDGPFLDEEFRDTFGDEGQALEQVFAEPAPEAQEPAPAAEAEIAPPPKKKGKRPREPKRRPARKKGYGLFGIPHIIATFVWIGLAIVIGTTAGNVLWLMASDVLAFGVEPKTVSITITEEDTLDTVAARLAVGQHRAFGRLHRHDSDIRILLLQITPHTRDGAAGSYACYEDIHFPFRLLPDFRAGGLIVGKRIGRIYKLIGNKAAGNGSSQFFRLLDRAVHA